MNDSEQSRVDDAVDLEFEFDQAPAKVWLALSEPELVAQWLAPGAISTAVGHRFDLQTKGGRVDCEVLASEPERLLSYRWCTADDAGSLDTVVTFFLSETASGGTHLRLVHAGFEQNHAAVATAQVLAFTAPRSKSTIVCEGGLAWAA